MYSRVLIFSSNVRYLILSMLITIATLLIQAAFAVQFPPPTGPYYVGYTQHVFNHTTPNAPVAPQNSSSVLLATIYYPTLTIPIPGNNTAPYLDAITAKLWGDILQYPNDSLQSLATWNVLKAPPLDKATYGISQKPTVIFSPAAGQNAIMYNALNSELASQGYTVLALDHPGEAPYVRLPDGREGIYGIDVNTDWNDTLLEAVYHMRVSDSLAVVRELYPSYVEATGVPFNTSHYIAIGHSIGGAASVGALAAEDSIIGGLNLDGLFIESPDVKKPFLMVSGAQHIPALDPSWSPFSLNQSGWYQWVNVTGSSHVDFSDLGDWVDLQGLRNKTLTPSLGTIWGPRAGYIVRTFISAFFSFVIGETQWLDVPSSQFPDVVYINGSLGDAGANSSSLL
jgi:pimeloyl-ACP methyl ester carboxylesterase